MDNLLYVSANVMEGLREGIKDNLDRYLTGSFVDMSSDTGWEIPLSIRANLAPLEDLESTVSPEVEIANSKRVWEALGHIRPSLACDERIWVRLTHIECLKFTRQRWLKGGNRSALTRSVRDHFFADTLTRRRDDNAVSRLWWNAYIAEQIMPGTDLEPLHTILKTADIRLNLVERSRTLARAPIAAGIIRVMERETWISEEESNFRSFMRVLNKEGAGILFECLPSQEIDTFMNHCLKSAQQRN